MSFIDLIKYLTTMSIYFKKIKLITDTNADFLYFSAILYVSGLIFILC